MATRVKRNWRDRRADIVLAVLEAYATEISQNIKNMQI